MFFGAFQAPGSVIKIAKGLAPCSAVLRESVKPVAQEENAIWTVTTLTPRSVSKPVLMAPAISSAQQWTVIAHARKATVPTSSAPLAKTAHRTVGTTVPIWDAQPRNAIKPAPRATVKCTVSQVQTCALCPVLVEIVCSTVMEPNVNATVLAVGVCYLDQGKRRRLQDQQSPRHPSQVVMHQGPCQPLWPFLFLG